ncbi:transcription termination/antitermination protein NusG [[Bacteroides] pectinophilus]|jgi:transcriptional antiterminator NusG|uniref:Transcription termination/antitermination protein NusG n=2 Tax=[Bacteroides] pectinophilus TaxID=384638 RepID=B7ARK1_9FIRM|nr:transcription termination/antitermination factor NusG [[Bacteroides] pectinophilus ATCC 43243]MCI6021321.1 transcription termination/antitermination protein NusG [[Bacteroides] pectinophilus]MDD5873394.1 transcription termination/antitermination protein NusG [Clostridia bacterium]CDD56216.1 transcription antitermination protein nusG [Bacteroides pectinophilus CAG:437]HBH93167.1 transcription termination/antitermination factor NusG [Bacteroides sp.]
MAETNSEVSEVRAEVNSEPRWYVVHTYSGYENKVMDSISKTIANRHLEDQILDVRVPVETVYELRANGTKKAVERKIFPGYVLVNMVMNEDTWYVVRNIRGVTGFVGPGSKPVPLTEEEMKPYGLTSNDSSESDKNVVVNLKVGDIVTVTGGAWAGSVKAIQSVNESRQTVTINVDMFSRETPVEISFSEVKKM